MGTVLTISLERDELSAVEAAVRGFEGVTLETSRDGAGLERDRGIEAVVVGAQAGEPVRLAQRAYRSAPDAGVVLISSPERLDAVQQSLRFAPMVREDVVCVATGEGQPLAEVMRGVLQRVRAQARHKETLASLNAQLERGPGGAPKEEILDQLLEHAPLGVVVVDDQARVRAMNRRASELLGVSEREALGGDVRGWVSGLGQFEQGERQVRVRHQERWVEVSASRVVGQGRQPGYLLLLEDVTERTELLARLEQAVRLRDDFLAIAAHELRTPLTSMGLKLDLLVRTLSGGGAERARALGRDLGKLNRLVAELLDVSRLTAGKLELHPERVDLLALVTEVVERLAGERNAQARIRVAAPEQPVTGAWDPMRLEQVVVNLLHNALKYGGDGPVWVTMGAQGGRAWLKVRDEGPGVAPEDQQRIFERFERAVSSRNFGGLGVGLWVSRQIVEAHRGQMGVESAPGHGATFTVELPQ